MALVIGFGGTFYTLWDIDIEPNYGQDSQGNTYYAGTTVNSVFIKNISKDIEKAKRLHPGLEVDEDLKGKSFSYAKQEELEPTLFNRGYSRGEIISECDDISSLKWSYSGDYYKSDKFADERRTNILNRITELGYVQYEYDFLTQEEIDKIFAEEKRLKDIENNKEKFFKKYENGGEIEIFNEKNPDDYGNIYLPDLGVHLYFPETKECWYKDFLYYIPVLNGKGKRIKNKNLKLSVISFEPKPEDDIYLTKMLKVTNFEVLKNK